MKSYRCVLFDLDHTLWDYETNSSETLRELFTHYRLEEKGIGLSAFLETFVTVNTQLWEQYDTGKIGRDVIRFERFHGIFQQLGLTDYELSLKFSDDYVMESPKKGRLMPYALETLDYLNNKYPMVIVTNGFDEIQATKISSSGIQHYFKSVVTSARAGFKKPAREIFEFALAEHGFTTADAIMIGDNLLTDIGGAHNASLDTVFYNPNKVIHQEKPLHEIHSLDQLMTIL